MNSISYSYKENALHSQTIHRKILVELCTTVTKDYSLSSVVSFTNYYPFGMAMPGRSYTGTDYRYGFQGQETDSEIKGESNSVNYKYRMHDPRVGRFFSGDPLAAKFPFYSPYVFSGNVVIHAVELEGLEPHRVSGGFRIIDDCSQWAKDNPLKVKFLARDTEATHIEHTQNKNMGYLDNIIEAAASQEGLATPALLISERKFSVTKITYKIHENNGARYLKTIMTNETTIITYDENGQGFESIVNTSVTVDIGLQKIISGTLEDGLVLSELRKDYTVLHNGPLIKHTSIEPNDDVKTIGELVAVLPQYENLEMVYKDLDNNAPYLAKTKEGITKNLTTLSKLFQELGENIGKFGEAKAKRDK